MKNIFIANAHSGKGKILKYKELIITKLSEKYGEIEWIETEYAGHATKLAKFYGDKCDYLFFSGGDGTLNEIVNGVMGNEKKPILGQIPSGTVNDFCKSINIKKNIKKSLSQLIYAEPRDIDIFCVGKKFGVYIFGFGVFTATSYETPESKKKKIGWLSYFFNGIKEIKSYKPQKVKFNNEDDINVALFLAINSKSVGGFKFNKNAKLDDGNLDLIIFKAKKDKISFSDLIRIAKLFLFGSRSISKSKYCLVKSVSSFSIYSESNIFLNFDGEGKGYDNSFELEVVPKAIKFLAPKK